MVLHKAVSVFNVNCPLSSFLCPHAYCPHVMHFVKSMGFASLHLNIIISLYLYVSFVSPCILSPCNALREIHGGFASLHLNIIILLYLYVSFVSPCILSHVMHFVKSMGGVRVITPKHNHIVISLCSFRLYISAPGGWFMNARKMNVRKMNARKMKVP
jgi:hypothetical protein